MPVTRKNKQSGGKRASPAKPSKQARTGRSAPAPTACPYCGVLKDPRGLSKHMESCGRKQNDAEAQRERLLDSKVAALLEMADEVLSSGSGVDSSSDEAGPSGVHEDVDMDIVFGTLFHRSSSPIQVDPQSPIIAATLPDVAGVGATRSTGTLRPTRSGASRSAPGPAVAGPSRPAAAAPSRPAATAPLRPAGAGASRPAGAGGSRPAAAGGSRPAAAGGSRPAAGGSCPATGPAAQSWIPQEDDIRVEYHPNSDRQSRTFRFEDFTRAHMPSYDSPPEEVPWWPFRSQADYDFARLCLVARLNKEQVNALIKLVDRIRRGEDHFSFSSHADMQNMWKNAYDRLTPFTKHVITVPRKGEPIEHELWTRNLKDYLHDLLQDQQLVSQMEFDAHKLMIYRDGRWVRFVDEPTTAEKIWRVQSDIPAGAKPLALSIYADQTRLSSFGTAKGHPVVARLLNLPVSTRNGRGKGGGRIVAWLPIIKENPNDKKKPHFVNYKREVWHQSFRTLLEPIKGPSYIGFWVHCGDNVDRQFYVFIMILSADYEEQCYMALIRGVNSNRPCPVCLVPWNELYDLLKEFELRTGPDALIILADARSKPTKKECEAVLQESGLRNIDNAFLELANSDPYEAISFDELHALDGGLWGRHIWPCLKQYIKNLGADSATLFDEQMDQIPRWRGLYHFKQAIEVAFTDGSKFEDLGKNALFAMHNILTEDASPNGYLLCSALRSYLEMSIYMGFELHTEITIEDGKSCQNEFGIRLQVYIQAAEATEEKPKDFNFPKAHTNKHGWHDFWHKGASRNLSTKVGEQMHIRPKQAWVASNKKDAAEQILSDDHKFYLMQEIDEQVAYQQEYLKAKEEAAKADSGDSDDNPEAPSSQSQHIVLGASQPRATLAQIETAHSDDDAFNNLPAKLSRFLTQTFNALNIPIPGVTGRFNLETYYQVIEHRQIQVNYESLVDWRQSGDLLRCHPDYHHNARYDGILFNTLNGPIFGQLIFLFTCKIADKDHSFALVQPYDAPVSGRLSKKDEAFRFFPIRPKPRARSEFIPVESIIRGALLVPDFQKPGHFLVHDLVDGDMYLRLKKFKRPGQQQ